MSAARLATLRLVRTPRSLVAGLVWVGLAAAAAFVERTRPLPSASHVLQGTFGSIALPLLVYGIVGGVLAGSGFGRAARPLVSFGAEPLRVAVSYLLVAVLVSIVGCALLSAGVAFVAHGPDDPPLVHDALTSVRVGAMAGAAYAAYFAFGASLLRSGIGRGALLAVDFVFGQGGGASALLTPRAHVRSLLGGPPAFELSQRASSVALVALTLAFALAALAMARRQRA